MTAPKESGHEPPSLASGPSEAALEFLASTSGERYVPAENGQQEYERLGGWWRDHPAYQAIQDSFVGCNNKPHLAFLVLTGLRRQGFEVVAHD